MAQDHTSSITERFTQYRDLSVEKNFTDLMDLIYPKLFDVVPRTQLVAMFEQLDDENMRFEFVEMDLAEISPVFLHEGVQYALVDYSGIMNIWLLSEQMQDAGNIAALYETYNKLYSAAEKMEKDGVPGFQIITNKQLFAIAQVGDKQWTFIENNTEQPMMMNMLLPEPVITHFTSK